jgi:very-short-patch-repair endonuclease
LAGLAAARAGGLRGGWQRDAIDVLVPGHRRGPDPRRRLPLDMPGVRVRRSVVLPPDDIQRAGPTRTSMARSVVDAAQWSRTSDEARVLVASACQQRLVTPQEVLAVVDRLPRARRRRLVTQTAADAAGGAESLAEIDFVRLCRRHRLPPPDLQERRKDSSGRIRYLDAYWRAFRVQAEVDGAHHMEVRHWEADMDRQNDVWIGGDVIVRFTAAAVRNRPDRVAAKLRRALVEAGWQEI